MSFKANSPVLEAMIIKRASQRTAATVGYAQHIAVEAATLLNNGVKLASNEAEQVANSPFIIPITVDFLAKLASDGKVKEMAGKAKEVAGKAYGKAKEGVGKGFQAAKGHVGSHKAEYGAGAAGAAGGAALGAKLTKKHEGESEEAFSKRKKLHAGAGAVGGAAAGAAGAAGIKKLISMAAARKAGK